MTIGSLIRASGLPSAEAELLTATALRQDRTWVIAHAAETPSREECVLISGFLNRRLAGEPVAYITGSREFFGRSFRVTPAVLIPRPSTEELVRAALSCLDHPVHGMREADNGIVIVSRSLRSALHPRIVADIGTGSGCIAITLALACPDIAVIATDVSAEALAVARGNADLHHVADRVNFLEGKDLDPVRDLKEPFLLISNPPYIPEGRILPQEVIEHEPRPALFGGEDGADILRRLFAQAHEHPWCAGIVFECEGEQAEALLKQQEN